MVLDSLIISPADPLWIAIALLAGLAARLVGQPPLVGFLLAGFLLHGLGAKGGAFLDGMADLGITLLLFTVGLKLKLHTLTKPEVWGVATIHMVLTTVLLAVAVMALALTGLPLVAGLDFKAALLVGFALSFSSTVLVVKILDELGATGSLHGRVAIGVLVVQDIAAVIFIALSVGKLPSPWALALIALLPLRRVLLAMLDRVGHGELLILFGITLALVGAYLFELLGIKGDVGALILGMLLASHPKTNELAKALLGFKELFLLGFFLSVGMSSLPGWSEIAVALGLLLFIPVKAAVFFGLFNRFHLRANSSWRTSINLANYSEFGLIVGAVAVSSGLLATQWLTVLAIALALSFAVSALFMPLRDHLYNRWQHRLKRFEMEQRIEEEQELDLAHVKVAVFGMGRMGTAAYNAMLGDFGKHLVGVEIDPDRAWQHQAEGRNVINGDATNPDFWIRAPQFLDGLKWVLLNLPTHQANLSAAQLLNDLGYDGNIAATAKYPDEEDALKAMGVHYTFNIYSEAGRGFANELEAYVARDYDAEPGDDTTDQSPSTH